MIQDLPSIINVKIATGETISFKVTRNMVYDYQSESEIPDLAKFTDELIEEVLVSAFFQHKSEKEIFQN